MKQPGVILLQIIIGAASASLVGTILITAWFQTNRAQASVDDRIDIYDRAALLHHQMERDFFGAFAPDFITTTTATPPPAPSSKPNVTPNKKAEQPAPEIALEKAFYATSNEHNAQVLSYITDNPLRIYDDGPTGAAKPRIARVVYRLEPDKEHKNSYILYRQEAAELEFNAYEANAPKPIRKYALVSGIKSLTIDYEYEVEQKKDAAGQESQKKEKPEYKTVKEWVEVKADQEKALPSLPHALRMTVAFWDAAHKREIIFKFIYTTGARSKEETLAKQEPTIKPGTDKTSPNAVVDTKK